MTEFKFTRQNRAPRTVGVLICVYAALLALVILFDAAWWLMALLALFGTFGQLCLIRALSQGEAAMLAPFAYTGLIFATLWGLLFFGEWPDGWSILGTTIIATAGLYVWYRETFGHRT